MRRASRARRGRAGQLRSPQQLVLYETARALAESPTLEEAAPRMLEAVCQALGLAVRRHLAGRIAPERSCDASARGTRQACRIRGVHRGHAGVDRSSAASACPDGSGQRREPAWIPDVTARRQLPARRGRRTRRPPCRVRPADHAGPPRAGRDGVLQPRHPRTRRRICWR